MLTNKMRCVAQEEERAIDESGLNCRSRHVTSMLLLSCVRWVSFSDMQWENEASQQGTNAYKEANVHRHACSCLALEVQVLQHFEAFEMSKLSVRQLGALCIVLGCVTQIFVTEASRNTSYYWCKVHNNKHRKIKKMNGVNHQLKQTKEEWMWTLWITSACRRLIRIHGQMTWLLKDNACLIAAKPFKA